MNKIDFTARLIVHDGKLLKAKKMATDCILIVKGNAESKRLLRYGWFFSSGKTEFVERENYSFLNALMTRMGNVGESMSRIHRMTDFSAKIYGPVSEEVESAVAQLIPKLHLSYQSL